MHTKRLGLFVITIVVLGIFYLPVLGREYNYTDMHLHYVNFVLETQGFDSLLKEMDSSGILIDRAVVFGLGYSISWPNIRPERTTYYAEDGVADLTPPMHFSKAGDYKLLSDFARLPQDKQKRIYPLLQGLDVMDRNEIYYVLEMFKNHPELCGIGELLVRKGVMNDVTPLLPKGNSYAMAPVYDFAAANGIPVLFHHNMADETPYNPDSVQDHVYMKEITDMVGAHPKTIFIWAHTGVSRNLTMEEHTVVLDRLLAAYPNLNFDISWFVWDGYIKDALPEWAALIMKYEDRFMLGSDKIGNFRALKDDSTSTGVSYEVGKYKPLLELIDSLSKDTVISNKLASGNINRVLDEIPCGCKSDKPFIFPEDDPWKSNTYERPIVSVKVSNDTVDKKIAVNKDYFSLTDEIRESYYRWNKIYNYAGIVTNISFPHESETTFGMHLFEKKDFKGTYQTVTESTTKTINAESILLFSSKERAFVTSDKDTLYIDTNWPTLPWWSNAVISKIIIPDDERLVLYSQEYYKGDTVKVLSGTSRLRKRDWEKTKSFLIMKK